MPPTPGMRAPPRPQRVFDQRRQHPDLAVRGREPLGHQQDRRRVPGERGRELLRCPRHARRADRDHDERDIALQRLGQAPMGQRRHRRRQAHPEPRMKAALRERLDDLPVDGRADQTYRVPLIGERHAEGAARKPGAEHDDPGHFSPPPPRTPRARRHRRPDRGSNSGPGSRAHAARPCDRTRTADPGPYLSSARPRRPGPRAGSPSAA